MAKNPADPPKDGFKISERPVTSSSVSRRKIELGEGLPELPLPYGEPLLVAIARDPQTMFVCWSVDWPAVFGNAKPADRCAHVRLRQNGNEKTVAVEPMSGSCAIEQLQAGETYSVELGYYAPVETWHSVVIGNEVMMPFASEAGDESVDVATIPFHLTFQRMLDAFRGAQGDDVAQKLAEFQERANRSELTREETAVLQAFELSAEDLAKTAAARQSLEKSPHLSPRPPFGGASSSEGFGGASWAS